MAISAQNSTLTIDGTAIGAIKSYSGFDGEASELDVTHLASTAKEFLIGLINNGTFGIEYFPDFTDAGQDALRAAAISGATVAMVLSLPTGSPMETATFNAVVKNAHSLSGAVDAPLEGSASLLISGAVTWSS